MQERAGLVWLSDAKFLKKALLEGHNLLVPLDSIVYTLKGWLQFWISHECWCWVVSWDDRDRASTSEMPQPETKGKLLGPRSQNQDSQNRRISILWWCQLLPSGYWTYNLCTLYVQFVQCTYIVCPVPAGLEFAYLWGETEGYYLPMCLKEWDVFFFLFSTPLP